LARIASTSTARVSPFATSSSVASFCWLLSLGGALRGEWMRETPPGAVLGALSDVKGVWRLRSDISRTIVGPAPAAPAAPALGTATVETFGVGT
jgi:hypothetical protein